MFLFALFRTFLQTGVDGRAPLTDDDAPRKPAEPESYKTHMLETVTGLCARYEREKEVLTKQIEELQKKLDVSAGATSEQNRIITELQEKLACKTKEEEAALRSFVDGAMDDLKKRMQAALKRSSDDGAAVGGPAKRPRGRPLVVLPEAVKLEELNMNLAKENYHITGNPGGWADLLQFLVTEKYGDEMVLTGDCRQTFGVQLSKMYKKWHADVDRMAAEGGGRTEG